MGGGGAERQLVYLAGASTQRGYEVHTALLAGGPNLDPLRRAGAHIHLANVQTHYDPRVFFAWRKVLRAVRPHVVHSWLPYGDYLGGVLALQQRIPWILSERCNSAAYEPFPVRKQIREFLGRAATAVVSNSPGGDAYWSDKLPAHVRHFVVPNAIAPELYEPDLNQQRVGAPSEVPSILVVGRLFVQKNIATLLRAAALACRSQKIRFLLCGEGPLRGELQQLVRELQLEDCVTFRGYERNVWTLLKQVDAFVSVSLYEGQPNAVMEAMASRCPLLLSDIPEHRALLPDDGALFVAPLDEVAIATRLLELLADPAKTRARAEVAYQTSLRFTVDAMADGYDRVYTELGLPVPVQRRATVA
jgi:glycosyltransferase involved in cell wall biosynthesis